MKIEVGKRYWRRDGGISCPVTLNTDGEPKASYLFRVGGEHYTEGGLYYESWEDPRDLIQEYVEPSQEVPGLEGYRIVRYGKAKKGDLFVFQGKVQCNESLGDTVDPWFIIEKLVPEKRTIVFREAYNRYGNRWSLDWVTEGDWPDELVSPDETVYTGNTREVTV